MSCIIILGLWCISLYYYEENRRKMENHKYGLLIIIGRMELLAGTVPANKRLLAGSVIRPITSFILILLLSIALKRLIEFYGFTENQNS